MRWPINPIPRGLVLGQDPDDPLCRGCEQSVGNEGELCAHCGEIAHDGCLILTSRAEKVCRHCMDGAPHDPDEDE